MTREEAEVRALGTVSESARPHTAVYLDTNPVAIGSRESYVAFIDPQPGVEWAHPCRYLLIPVDGGEVQSIESMFPPSVQGRSPTLRLIYKGGRVPDWAVSVR